MQLSTVYLVIDHAFAGNRQPVLFESMLFPEQELVGRYSTLDDAFVGHYTKLAEFAVKGWEATSTEEKLPVAYEPPMQRLGKEQARLWANHLKQAEADRGPVSIARFTHCRTGHDY